MTPAVEAAVSTCAICLFGGALAICLAVAGISLGVAADAMVQMWRRRRG